MDFDKLISDARNPLSSVGNFIHLERYVNNHKGSWSDYSEVNEIYSPTTGMPEISLPFAAVPKAQLSIFLDNPTPDLQSVVFEGDNCLFAWHPDIASPFGEKTGEWLATPTSSTRTLLVETKSVTFMVKTDLDKRHFRFRRRLKGSSVQHSIAVSRELRKAAADPRLARYGYMPETIGLVYGDLENGSGVVFRELLPLNSPAPGAQYIPYFSLYSSDLRQLDDLPLLTQLILHNTSRDRLTYFVESIVGPLQDAWVQLVLYYGLLPELHGQNALLELDANGCPCRVIHRDLQSIYSDQVIRDEHGQSPFAKHVIGTESGIDREQQYSLVFDHFICHYLVDRLVDTFCGSFKGYPKAAVCASIRDRFRSIPGNPLDVFPKTRFRFGDQPMLDNNVTLVDTGEIPLYR